MITITPDIAPGLILRVLKAGLTPMLLGNPGISKSSLIAQVAKENNLKIIDLRLAQMDISDLMGLPYFNEDHSRSDFIPPAYLPLEGDEIPQGYKGWCLVFDELSQAPPMLQNASFKIILDRMVGQQNLHKNVAIIAAGNKATDKAHTHKMSTALQSRMVHFELTVSSEAWLDWATKNDIDYRIQAYIGFKPDSLFRFDPNHNDCTFASPRTWAFLSKLIKDEPEISYDLLPLMAGTVSEGIAREFYAFIEICQDLPTIEKIMDNPEGIEISDRPDINYALSSLASIHLSKNTATKLFKFIVRLPMEFMVITVRQALKRNPELVTTPEVKEWVRKYSIELFE